MEWLRSLFSAGLDIKRLNSAGICLMAAALVLSLLAGKLASAIQPSAPDKCRNTIKIISLVICAGGALLAILG